MASAPLPTLGIDIGGSKSLIALVNGAQVADSICVPTRIEDGPDAWLAATHEAAGRWNGAFRQVAAAVSGGVQDGVWQALNRRTLDLAEPFPLSAQLNALFDRPVTAFNDAQAAAWGEHQFGAGHQRDMVFLTVSTGLGGGMVLGGRLCRGDRGIAGHFGQGAASHLTDGPMVPVGDHATGRWIAQQAEKAGHPCADARAVFAAATSGAGWAERIIDISAKRVASLCASIQLSIDPPAIILGGGIGLAADYLARVERHLMTVPAALRPIIRPAALGRFAGVIGAADLAASSMPQASSISTNA